MRLVVELMICTQHVCPLPGPPPTRGFAPGVEAELREGGDGGGGDVARGEGGGVGGFARFGGDVFGEFEVFELRAIERGAGTAAAGGGGGGRRGGTGIRHTDECGGVRYFLFRGTIR